MSATPNQDAFYAAQHEEINNTFIDENADEDELCSLLDQALSDPFLPRWYRTKYHIIRAWYGNSEENIQDAKEGMEDMRQVYRVEEKTEEWIAARLSSLQEMLDLVESCLVDADEPAEPAASPNHATSSGEAAGSASNTQDQSSLGPSKVSSASARQKSTRCLPIQLLPIPVIVSASSQAAESRSTSPPNPTSWDIGTDGKEW